jgi:RNA polymerase sigma-70 factor (ECF subfamily)
VIHLRSRAVSLSTRPTHHLLDHRDDLDLVRSMALGDETSLAQLYDRHAPRLLALGRQVLREHQEAEDVAHDVFMEAWHKAASFDEHRGSVRGWLLLRMRSRCLDRVRAAAVRRDAPEHAPPRPIAFGTADDVHSGPDGERVRTALATLPDPQQQALDLLYFQGLSSSEAAAQLGCPVGTLKSRVRLAMRTLREQLGVLSVEPS